LTGFNHAATGAILALTIKQPALVLPLAFVSHLVLDSVPHFGVGENQREVSKSAERMLWSDIILVPSFFIAMLLITQNWLVIAAMLMAILPDLIWFPSFAANHFFGKSFKKPTDPFTCFHSWIQWGERPWGWIIEIQYSFVAIFVLTALR
jgi:hypothetical protein